jgi:hypothetical protein
MAPVSRDSQHVVAARNAVCDRGHTEPAFSARHVADASSLGYAPASERSNLNSAGQRNSNKFK